MAGRRGVFRNSTAETGRDHAAKSRTVAGFCLAMFRARGVAGQHSVDRVLTGCLFGSNWVLMGFHKGLIGFDQGFDRFLIGLMGRRLMT